MKNWKYLKAILKLKKAYNKHLKNKVYRRRRRESKRINKNSIKSCF